MDRKNICTTNQKIIISFEYKLKIIDVLMVYRQLNLKPTQNFNATKPTFEKARSLRKNMTEPEHLLWGRLRKGQVKGLHFRKQHPIDAYIVDFYCHKQKLVIEVDGPVHDFQKEYDINREKFLIDLGLRVCRFSNEEILNDIDEVIKRIESEI